MRNKVSTEELMNDQIAGLSPAKRALLELTLKQSVLKSAGRAAIPRRTHHSPVSLSFAQQRMWFLTQLDPESPAYNIPVAHRLTGTMDVEAMGRAFKEIVRRHESLRTRFEDVAGVPQQVIDEVVEWPLKVIDLSGKAPGEQATEAQSIAREEALRPFALGREWGLRAQLLRLSETEHILLLTMHHIVSDGWSIGRFFAELQQLYEAYHEGTPSPLPELPLQYADFAVWQREWLSGAELQKQLSYWKEQLTGVIPVELPLDQPRPATPSYRGEKQSLMLSRELSRQLQALARTEGVTLFMVMLAAFQVLLSRYSGQTNICVGTPIANRNRAQLEELIGFFVNTLVLRADVSGNPSFVQLLQHVREVALEAYAHQDLPFEKLVDELQPERSLSRNPLFDVIFAVQNAPRTEAQFGGLSLEPWGEGPKTTHVDLEVYVREEQRGIGCVFVYATDLFEPETIQRLMKHYELLLEAVVTDPNRTLSELSLLMNAERQQLLVDWNKTGIEYPEKSIAQLFEEQAARQEAAIAVTYNGESLTYAELNERANRLAHYLLALGVGAETRVGLCMDRSLDFVVGLLGILKAGGTYVPLDPAYPEVRLEYMVADAGVKLLLTHSSLAKNWRGKGLRLVELDRCGEEIGSQSDSNPSLITSPDDLAYVLYTSGSTGRPKGVASSHRASINRFEWMWRAYPFAAGDVCCQKTSISFVDSFWEIFGPLLQGVPLVIIDDDTTKDPAQLVAALSHHKVSRLLLVPSLLRAIVETEDDLAERLEHLRYCVCSGEILPVELATAFRQKLPHTVLLNLYGSSEVAADVTSYEVTTTDCLRSVPIGKPIANTQTYILDQQLQPVPIGVAGDLYIAGAGLARGYLNSPELTAEKFIPNHFSRTGARMFRTGDVARYLQDGNIEFLGRHDHQVKIRGFRIETDEVELALKEHPNVRNAVVLAQELNSSEKRLVAYLVLQAKQKITIEELRRHLQESLPDYMIPSAFVVLDELPLTGSGKVDRQQLPDPDAGRPELAGNFVAPQTAIEQQVVKIWEQVLNLKRIGVEDNFFALGGHSLLATQLMWRLNDAFGLRLPLRTVFEAPTVRRMAEVITSTESFVWPTVMKIQPLGKSKPIFFVAAPNVNALGYIALAEHLHEDQPLYGLQSQKYLKTTTDEYGRPLVEFSQSVVEELATEYVQAMREVQPHGPYMLGGMCRGAHIAFEMALQLKAQGETVSLLAILDTWVMENSYSWWFYVDYYIHRVPWFLKLGAREKVQFVKKITSKLLNKSAVVLKLRTDLNKDLPPVKAVYWPGPSFVPRVYDGPITVFRVPKQSAIYIRSHALAWEKRSTRNVQVEIVQGKHDTILREPSVKILAARLTEIIAAIEAETPEQTSTLI